MQNKKRMLETKAIAGYLLVGILWGCTNPFIKHAQDKANAALKDKENSLNVALSGTNAAVSSLNSSNNVVINHTNNINGPSGGNTSGNVANITTEATVVTSSTLVTKNTHIRTTNNKESLLPLHRVDPNSSNKSHTGFFRDLFQRIKRLIRNLNLFVPFLFNQTGSIVFYMLLATQPVSVAAPVCNSLTFLFTALTSLVVFKEYVRHPIMLLIGTVFIIAGTVMCLQS